MRLLILGEALLMFAASDPPAAWSDNPPAAWVERAKAVTYADAYARARSGERVTWTGQPPGMDAGTYTLWLDGGVVVLRKEVTAKPVTIFRGATFDPDHTCDRCGREQRVIEQSLPDGRHTHRCAGCGAVWRH